MEALDVKNIIVKSNFEVLNYIMWNLTNICNIKSFSPILEGGNIERPTGKWKVRIRLHYREGQRDAKKAFAEAEAEAKRVLNIK